jgi:GNAT superfamily N-acetyltransferase
MTDEPQRFEPFDGWRPGIIGELVALQATYYARHWGFGAAGAASFLRRYDPRLDLLTSFVDAAQVAGSVTVDGSDPDRPDDLAHLRWFILSDAARGHGLGRKLIARALEFARGTGRAGVYLWTFAGLEAARHLYDQAGFHLVEERPGDTWGTRVLEQRFELRFEQPPGRVLTSSR